MTSYTSKKRVFLVRLVKSISIFLALCITLIIVITTTQVISARVATNGHPQLARARRQAPGPVGNSQQNSQTFVGHTNSGNTSDLAGINQGNSGNQGMNRGFSQDNSSNGGNQLNTQRKHIAYQKNDQSLAGSGSNGDNNTTFIGANQGNSGNQGTNTGFNQDNASNSGNQVNNQGAVIGTQINNQGTDVNNNGSRIGKQINHISLLPPLHLNLTLKPRPHLNVELGK